MSNIMKDVQVDSIKYYQPGEIENLKKYVLRGTAYIIKQEKLLLASQKMKKLRKIYYDTKKYLANTQNFKTS